MTQQLSLVNEVLRFTSPGDEAYNAVTGRYLQFVQERFKAYCSELARHDEAEALLAEQKAARLSNGLMHPLFMKPAFTDKLLNYDFAKHLPLVHAGIRQAIDAELARQEKRFDTSAGNMLWTCNGDYLIYYDPESSSYDEFESPKLTAEVHMDFFSPACSDTVNDDITKEPGVTVGVYNPEEAETIAALIDESFAPATEKMTGVSAMLNKCTDVIVIKKFNGDDYFYSSSNGEYVGTIFLVNPEKANKEAIANALVHESIHSLLLMIDHTEKWMPQGRTEAAAHHIPSHWTGRPLPMRSYLQANYVWYGLYHFWKNAQHLSLYDPSYIADRLTYIRNGFANAKPGILPGMGITPAVTDCLIALKETVLYQ